MKKAGKSPKPQTCLYEGENGPMKGNNKGFRLKLLGHPGTLPKKGGKMAKNGTCVYEREYVPMKGKSKSSSLKPIGDTSQKRLEK